MLDMKPTVLVVEDEVGVRNLVSTILRLSGFDVLACCDGDEAMELARSHGGYVHLAITDVDLGPSLDGRELAHGLRALFPAMRILYISGREDIITKEELEGGKAFFLAKPFTPKTLTAKVSAILADKFRTVQAHPGL